MNAAGLKQRLRADLKAAMQARAAGEVRLLRTLIAALDNAEAVPAQARPTDYRPRPGDPNCEVPRLELDAAAVEALLAVEIEARRAAAADYRQGGRDAEADALIAEIALVERYFEPGRAPLP